MTFRTLSTSRRVRVIALGAALLTVAGGATAWSAHATSTTSVSLSVDGVDRVLAVHGKTVGDVLSRAHLQVGPHDLLAPSASTRIKDGSRVVLRRGRELRLVVDGNPRTVWVTASSVDEAIGQIGLRVGGAVLSADRSREIPLKGFSLDVRTRKDVRLVVAGKVRLVATNGLVVQDAFRQAHVAVRPADRLSVPLLSPLRDGQVISLTRVDGPRLARDVRINFGTLRRPDAGLYSGTTRLISQGHPGNHRQTFLLSVINGREVGRRLVADVLTTRAVDTVIGYGTRSRPAPAPAPAPVPAPAPAQSTAPSSSGGLNWGALANCESGGNPRAVSSSGSYRGLYQFSLSTWHGVGGVGDPIDASSSEQTHRAQILYSRTGASSWPVCGKYL